MDYYIDVKNRDFMFDFTDLALNSKLILAVEDNVTTTKMTTSKSVSFSDGSGGTISSETVINENVQDKMELTYVDTWFVKFSKEENYENLSGIVPELVGPPAHCSQHILQLQYAEIT